VESFGGSTIEDDDVRRLFREGKASQRMTAVVLSTQKGEGKSYRLATEKDLEFYRLAEEYLEEKRKKLWEEWGIDPVPDEDLPPENTLGFRVQRYGMLKWGDLFNSRQKLALITFTEKVRLAYKKMLEEGYDKDYAKAVVSYLGCANSRLIDQSTVLVPWITQLEAVAHTFNRQALGMVWDYIEALPFTYFESSLDWVIRIINHLTQIPPVEAEE
jgi:putative DNA methylase